MDKYLTSSVAKASSLESLTNKRNREEDGTWVNPKRTAFQRNVSSFTGSENLRISNRFAGLNTDEEGESNIIQKKSHLHEYLQ